MKKCSICGKEMKSGYAFDDLDFFCSWDCIVKFFNGNEKCVKILLDEGSRVKWYDDCTNISPTDTSKITDTCLISTVKTFHIKSPEDIIQFFIYLTFDLQLSWHPDDPFENYVDSTNTPTFSKRDAKYLNGLMETCFQICQEQNLDIYIINNIIAGLYFYCHHCQSLAGLLFQNLTND